MNTSALDIFLQAKYLDIKIYRGGEKVGVQKLESLTGGSGVHVFLVLWKAARAAEAYAEKSVSGLEMCGSDFAVLEALLHKGRFPLMRLERKFC